MKLHFSLLALAISALVAAPVMAQEHGQRGDDEASISSTTKITNDISVRGTVRVHGNIKVKAESASVIDQNQASNHNSQRGLVDNSAKLGGSALSGAEGNIGVNIAAGVGNAQANDAAMTAVDGSKVFASAMIFSQQNASNNSMDPGGTGHGHGHGGGGDDPNTATLGGSALSDAKGNVGVNIAAGVGNVQGNALAASVNGSGSLAKATSDTDQSTTMNAFNNGGRALFTNTATLNGSALSGAQGNIGVNIAAGLSNVQHNSLALATATGE